MHFCTHVRLPPPPTHTHGDTHAHPHAPAPPRTYAYGYYAFEDEFSRPELGRQRAFFEFLQGDAERSLDQVGGRGGEGGRARGWGQGAGLKGA